METLKLRDGLLAIERIGRPEKHRTDGFFTLPEESSSLGIVKFAAPGLETYIGKKVLFGTKREEIRALGKDLIFMEAANVFATVEAAPVPAPEKAQ